MGGTIFKLHLVIFTLTSLWEFDRAVMYLPLKQFYVGSTPTVPTKIIDREQAWCRRLTVNQE